jgi:hypothetical protein
MRWAHPFPSLIEMKRLASIGDHVAGIWHRSAHSEGALAHWRRHDEWSAGLHDDRISLGPGTRTRVWLMKYLEPLRRSQIYVG